VLYLYHLRCVIRITLIGTKLSVSIKCGEVLDFTRAKELCFKAAYFVRAVENIDIYI
jgi:hypothetical protein